MSEGLVELLKMDILWERMENSPGPFLDYANRSFDLWYVHTGSGLREYDLGTPKLEAKRCDSLLVIGEKG